jgi:hypothetical protein
MSGPAPTPRELAAACRLAALHAAEAHDLALAISDSARSVSNEAFRAATQAASAANRARVHSNWMHVIASGAEDAADEHERRAIERYMPRGDRSRSRGR